MEDLALSGWALVLGASSGFGEATAVELARSGMNIFGVHLDRRATLPNAERILGEIRGLGRQAEFWNVNAADEDKRKELVAAMAEKAAPGTLRVLLHSLAFGTLRRLFPEDPAEALTKPQMEMTLDVMASSLVYWTQAVVGAGLMVEGGRIYAMTSAGSSHVWPAYGAVSAAKAALESNVRQIAYELAPRRITANAILAGVTDTPALRKIPGNAEMLEAVRKRNPSRRLTTPVDVARAIAALAHPKTAWMTGNTIRVDGGEELSG